MRVIGSVIVALTLSCPVVCMAGPDLLFSTYLGGDQAETAVAAAIGPDGSAFVLLETPAQPENANIIRHLAPSPFGDQPQQFFVPRGKEIVLVKYAPDFNKAEFIAVIGGLEDDEPLALAIDRHGNPIILARTTSSDLPTSNPLQATLSGTSDAAIIKLSADGQSLLFSTYLGGSSDEFGFQFIRQENAGMAVDAEGDIHITGTTFSQDFPTTSGAFRESAYAGAPDIFVTKIKSDGSRLLYSTYLGGNADDGCNALAIDADGRAWVAGGTASADFPLVRPINRVRSSTRKEPFLARLSPEGDTLELSTYLIGEGDVGALALGPNGEVALAGISGGALPTTARALQSSAESFSAPGFVVKLDASVTKAVYSTYLGGHFESVRTLAFDHAGNLLAAGSTSFMEFVVVNPSEQASPSQLFSKDAYVVKLSPTGETIYSTRIGGLGNETLAAMAVFDNDDILLAGTTDSFDLPLERPLRDNPIADDAFVIRLSATFVASPGNPTETPADETVEDVLFTDRTASQHPRRFYRARALW